MKTVTMPLEEFESLKRIKENYEKEILTIQNQYKLDRDKIESSIIKLISDYLNASDRVEINGYNHYIFSSWPHKIQRNFYHIKDPYQKGLALIKLAEEEAKKRSSKKWYKFW